MFTLINVALAEEPAPTGEPGPNPDTTPVESEGPPPAEEGGGVVGGEIGGSLSPGTTRVGQWQEIQVRKRRKITRADYPEEASARGLGDQRCVVRIFVDEEGMPTRAEPRSCAEPFHESARAIAMRFRFYPLVADGKPVPGQFDMTIQFKAEP
ncbi:MAG: energy transducer TonB [Myxococcota bacterium]